MFLQLHYLYKLIREGYKRNQKASYKVFSRVKVVYKVAYLVLLHINGKYSKESYLLSAK